MADKRIRDFPTLSSVNDNDLVLVDSSNDTYNVRVSTFKAGVTEAATQAASDAATALEKAQAALNAANTASTNAQAAMRNATDATNAASAAERSAASATALARSADSAAEAAQTAAYNAQTVASQSATAASNATNTANAAYSRADSALGIANTASTNAATAINTSLSAESAATGAVAAATRAESAAIRAESTVMELDGQMLQIRLVGHTLEIYNEASNHWRVATLNDLQSYVGFTNMACSNGDFGFTSSQVYSGAIFADSITKVRYVYGGTLENQSQPMWFIFRRDGNDFYGTDSGTIFKFTRGSGKYSAAAVTGVTDMTVLSVATFRQDGVNCLAVLDNGVLTITNSAGGQFRFTNANCIGWWDGGRGTTWHDVNVGV